MYRRFSTGAALGKPRGDHRLRSCPPIQNRRCSRIKSCATPQGLGFTLFVGLALLAAAQDQDTPTSGAPDFDAFRLIIDRNIFNPNRSGRPAAQTPRSTSRSPQTDSFTLVGTLGDKGDWIAFFDGSRSEFRGRLKLQDPIADYVVSDIANSGVLLVNGTNQLHLSVGTRMRREDNGPWLPAEREEVRHDREVSARTESPTANTSSGSSSNSSSSETAADSDVLRRLMQQRERELQ
jgi:hypothetical protein